MSSLSELEYGQNAFTYISAAKKIEKAKGTSYEDIEAMQKEMLQIEGYDKLVDYYNKRFEGLSEII